MYVSASSSSRSSSTFKQVLSSPLYRGATIAMFLSGLGVSAAAPQIVLFLVKELGTPLPIAGLYYLTNLTAPIAGYLVGNHSDRTGERLILFRFVFSGASYRHHVGTQFGRYSRSPVSTCSFTPESPSNTVSCRFTWTCSYTLSQRCVVR